MIYLLETMNGVDFPPVYLAGGLGASMLPLLMIDRALQAQRGHFLPWVPVCLGGGIGLFFWLPEDPGVFTLSLVILVGVLALPLLRCADGRSQFAWAMLLISMGFSTALMRVHLVEAPVLGFRYYGPVEGRVIALDRSGSNALRMTLDQLRLARLAPKETPDRLRISLVSDQNLPPIGAVIGTTAHLMPPQGPSEPGGFDFRRYAWFHQLGANGYTRNPVLVLQPAQTNLVLKRLRDKLSRAIRGRMSPRTGGFAAAIITGDRSGVSKDVLQALRGSNLAHLLAISGLHMGLLSGFVFALLRFGLCLVPPLALRCNVKKIAAVGALFTAVLYLSLSGGNVATERAFIMVLVMLVAVLLDRRAFSLRAVAIAAILVLLRRPETLLSPGFQMSFAATTALVAVFGWIRDNRVALGPDWLRPVLTVLVSSAVAGLATAPFGAAHFNTLAQFGLLANVLAVPIMGLIVVPSAVLTFLLAAVGLEAFGFWVMDMGLQWILAVAAWVSALPNAQSGVATPESWVLPCLSLGGLFVVLWQGRLRWAGLSVIVVSLGFWTEVTRPKVLISSNGGLVGVMMPEGRALSRDSSQSFTAKAWLAADGERVSQAQAAQRWHGMGDTAGATDAVPRVEVAGFTLFHVIGKRQAELIKSCSAQDLIVSNVALEFDGPCLVLQPKTLRHTGSIEIAPHGALITSAGEAGNRPWSRP